MKRALRFFIATVTCFLAGFLITAIPVMTHYAPAPEITSRQLTSHKNISNAYTISQTKAIKKSTSSAVRVVSIVRGEDTGQSSVSFASGTYFKYLGKHYVLTVSHAVVGDCDDLMVAYFDTSSKCVEIAYVDEMTDYAIIEIEEMKYFETIIKDMIEQRLAMA